MDLTGSADDLKRERTIRTAYDSETFDKDVQFKVERDVGSATISPSGRDVALASKAGLDIIDLDSPLNSPRHLPYAVQWKIVDVQWSPFAARDYWIVSTANQKALVWNLMMPEEKCAVQHTLHGHSRAITDINFSAHHYDILSTCAVDGYVHCWDLRRPRAPVMTFVDWFAGATQVKYNRQDSHILASSHDRWLRIWDDRKGAYPLRSIEAHESKIYGVDWNRTKSSHIATCSVDKSIKFWDYSNPDDVPEQIIRTDYPVWRARHTPFGTGLLAIPHTSPGTLYLYDRKTVGRGLANVASPPVSVFPGHGKSKVKEFLWRSRGEITDDGVDNREFQLVSWGEDQTLRMQRVDPETQSRLGFAKGQAREQNLNVTRKGAVYRTFRNIERTVADRDGTSVCMPHPRDIPAKIVSGVLTSGVKKRSKDFQNSRRATLLRAGGGGRNLALMEQHNHLYGDKTRSKGRDQIRWISGIKISKQVPGPRPDGQYGRRYSLLNREFEDEGEWDDPESLHDETIRVFEQYSRVTCDEADIHNRKVAASMHGPWGENGATVFLKVDIEFPPEYPSRPPRFAIGKSSLIPQETWEKLSSGVSEIATNFALRGQGCLETAICFLIGDLDLAESTMWFGHENPDDIDDIGSDSSSDGDEDEIAAGASALMSQELDSSATAAEMIPHTRNAPPPPRLCGAVFAHSGELVCFFPPKTDKTKSLLGTLGDNKERFKGEPDFESFGRLNANTSPEPRTKLRTLSRYAYESSDDSNDGSSSDSDSSQYRPGGAIFPWRRAVNRSYMKPLSTNLSQRSGSATGTGTAAGTAASRGRATKSAATISIHNMHDVVPAKPELAAEYVIFGDGREVCEHNAAVAEKYGYQDLADVWRYAGMLLESNIPLTVLDRSKQREPVLVIARHLGRRKRTGSGSDSGVDVSADRKQDGYLSARVKWGYHPLARLLIADLFEYFVKLADIQMLGMLSCIFSEPLSQEAHSLAEVQMFSSGTPLAMKTPAFSLNYFPSNDIIWNTDISAPLLAPILPRSSVASIGPEDSPESNGAWAGNPAANSYSLGDTPPLPSGKSSGEKHRSTTSLSTSPDDTKLYRKAQTFAASFSRPFAMTVSSSPPGRKRASPVESVLGSLAPNGVTWGQATILGSVKENSQVKPSRNAAQPRMEAPDPSTCTGIKVSMQNQNYFDDEGCMSTSLLDVHQPEIYHCYRSTYASLLFAWGHPLAALEIQKLNGLPNYFDGQETVIQLDTDETDGANSNHTVDANSPIPFGKQGMDTSELDVGLDVAGYCLRDEMRLQPLQNSRGGAVGRCERCKTVQRQLRCVICQEPVSTSYTACLSCGCVAHEPCQSEYHASGGEECAGGCDCICTESADRGVVEGWEVMMGIIEMMRQRHNDDHAADGNDEWSEAEDWEIPETAELTNTRSFDSAVTVSPHASHRGHPSLSSTRGYGTLGKRLEAVKTGEWGSKLRRKTAA